MTIDTTRSAGGRDEYSWSGEENQMRKNRNMGSRLKRVPVVVLACVGVIALALGLAGPANADPSTTYVGVGSDTIQDVMDQFVNDESPGEIGSWDAVNPVTAAA